MPHGRAREREESFVYSGKRNERERTGSVCARDSSCVIWIVGNRWLKRDEQQQQQRKRMERRRDESLCTTALLPFAIIQRRKAKRKIPKNFVAPVPDIGNQRDDAIRRRSGENNVDIKDLFGGKSIGLKKTKTKRTKYRTMRGKSIIGTAADEFIRCAPSADWKLQTALPRTFPLLPSSTTTKHLFVGNKEKCLNYSIAHQLVVMWRGWSIYLCSRLLPI